MTNETTSPLITFSQLNVEVMRIEANGRFFVRGREVETTEEIRDIFARWCALTLKEKGVVD